jgi:hypothetical protein
MVLIHDRNKLIPRQHGQPIALRKLTGVMIGLAGVATCVGVLVVRIDGWVLLAVGARLLAALSYAIGSTVRRSSPLRHPKRRARGWPTDRRDSPARGAGGSHRYGNPSSSNYADRSLFLGLVCTGAALVAYSDLIHRVEPVSAVTVTLLAPVFGIAWAVVLLGEQISLGLVVGMALGLVVGMALVLVGVAIIVGPRPTKSGRGLDGIVRRVLASPPNDARSDACSGTNPSWTMRSGLRPETTITHAEFVALGIGHDMPSRPVFRHRTAADAASAK